MPQDLTDDKSTLVQVNVWPSSLTHIFLGVWWGGGGGGGGWWGWGWGGGGGGGGWGGGGGDELAHWRIGYLNDILDKKKTFKIILLIDGWGFSYEITLRWMSADLTDVKSTLVQVMAWCRQATSHCLSQCCPVIHVAISQGHMCTMSLWL